MKFDLKAVKNELVWIPWGKTVQAEGTVCAKFSRQGVPGGWKKSDEANTCVHSSIAPRNQPWEPPKRPSDDWTNTVCSGHTVPYYWVMKRNRISDIHCNIFIMLNEVSQIQKDKYSMTALASKFTETES